MKLTRDLRNALRSQVTNNSGWAAWRAANLANTDGTLRDAASMTRVDLLRSAIDLNIDIPAIAGAFGLTVTWPEIHTDMASFAHFATTPVAAMASSPDYTAAPSGIQALVSGLAPPFPTVSHALAAGMPGTASEAVSTPVSHASKEAPMTSTTTTTAAASIYAGKDIASIIREALAPADGMVGQKLFDQLVSAVTPLAEIAVAPPPAPVIVEKEVIKTVTVRAPGAAGESADTTLARLCQPSEKRSGREVFGVKGSVSGTWRAVLDEPVTVWDGTAAEGVPALDPYHVWDLEALAYMAIASRFADDGHALREKSRVLMYGPAGTGKTTGAMQFAARTGRPFIRIAFDRSTEAAELVGQRMPKAGGGTVYHEGALTQAMQVPGCVILLDEPSFLRPGVAAVLQTILDTGTVYLKEDGNRAVAMAPGVVIFGADNTALNGDETGRYADTLVQNIALQDRFAWLVPLDYMPESQEAMVLHNRVGVPVEAAKHMVTFATATRRGAANGQLTAGCSLRRLIAWATAVKAGIPSQAAFKSAIMNAADPADRESVRGIEKNAAGHGAIDAVIAGKGAPAGADMATGMTGTAQGSAAASVFGNAPSSI
jgi:MoxR-like ATPase